MHRRSRCFRTAHTWPRWRQQCQRGGECVHHVANLAVGLHDVKVPQPWRMLTASPQASQHKTTRAEPGRTGRAHAKIRAECEEFPPEMESGTRTGSYNKREPGGRGRPGKRPLTKLARLEDFAIRRLSRPVREPPCGIARKQPGVAKLNWIATQENGAAPRGAAPNKRRQHRCSRDTLLSEMRRGRSRPSGGTRSAARLRAGNPCRGSGSGCSPRRSSSRPRCSWCDRHRWCRCPGPAGC